MSAAVLEIEDLSVGGAGEKALSEISLSVDAGEVVALIGANGAGKSTLLRSIMGELRPVTGDIRLDGASLLAESPDRRARRGIGFCPEGRRIFPGMTVRENLEVASWDDSRTRSRRIDVILAMFPALAERQAAVGWQLSGGQQQMLAIGRALMGAPNLVLLDEPSLGLSPILVSQMFQAVREIARDGTAVLLAEQNAAQALSSSHRAVVLQLGRVAVTGRAAALREDSRIRSAYLGSG